MNLTTTQRVKERLDKSQIGDNEAVYGVVVAVSHAMAADMDLLVEQTSRTEIHSPEYGARRIFLKATPVASVSTVHNDSQREYGSSSLVAASDYYVDTATGVLLFDYPIISGPGSVQVVYTGGIAASVEGLVSAGYGDIVDAATTQAVHQFQRRRTPHLSGFSDPTGNTTFTSEIDWLPIVRKTMARYRRWHDAC